MFRCVYIRCARYFCDTFATVPMCYISLLHINKKTTVPGFCTWTRILYYALCGRGVLVAYITYVFNQSGYGCLTPPGRHKTE